MIAAIIQARMSSTRLPGKVLKKVLGKTLLEHQLDRIRSASKLDRIVVATSTSVSDSVIADLCREKKIECFRGSENDVLGRYYECAKSIGADTIVRLTADCPLSDPDIVDKVVGLFLASGADYAGNTVPPNTSKFPDGTDVEVFTMASLERANKECKDPHDREHVTFYFWKHNNGFKLAQLANSKDYSKYRFTVDYPEDFEVVKFILKALDKRKSFGHVDEIIEILDSNPEVKAKNSRYYFGIGWEKSKKAKI